MFAGQQIGEVFELNYAEVPEERCRIASRISSIDPRYPPSQLQRGAVYSLLLTAKLLAMYIRDHGGRRSEICT